MIRYVTILILTCAGFMSRAQVNIITTIAGNGVAGYTGDGGPASSAGFSWPCAIIFDKNNGLVLCDCDNNAVRRMNLSTGIVSTIAGIGSAGFFGDAGIATAAKLNAPDGVCLDENQNIYISDGSNARIRKIDATTGIISTVVGNGIAGFSGDASLAVNAQINIPVGVFFHDIYIYIYIYPIIAMGE